jgi:hypothetical protein
MRKKLSWSAILAAIAAAVALSRGGHHGPPSPPDDPPPVPTYTLNVHICDGTPCVEGDEHHKVPGATVAYADDKPAGVTDGSGNVDFPGVPAGGYHVCAKADGYTETCVDAALPAGGSVFLVLAPNVPPVLALRIDGKVFRDSTGAIWPYRGVTAFTLLERVAKGEDIGPYLDKRRAAGANLVRVLSTMKFITNLPPESYSDSQLAALFATAHAHGVRVEIVALADATDWPLAKQRAHVQRIVDAVAAAGALDLVEVSNEAFKNSAPPRDIMPGVTRRAGVLMASGGDGPTCDNLSPFVLDYVTYHPERKDEWPRTAKDELELRDGFGCKDANGNDAPGYGGAHVPVVADEPMGADEVDQSGKRATRADDFFWFGATSQLLGAGGTFHSTAGITTTEPGPVQAAAEKAFFAGMSSVPLDAQLRQYSRGGQNNSERRNPLWHDDWPENNNPAGALRTFCMLAGGGADCVVIRPGPAWTATAQDGWQIQSSAGPRGTVLRLAR